MPMYAADKDKVASRPVIGSQAAAAGETRRWLEENRLDQIRDGDGWAWTLEVKVTQVDDPSDPRRVLWQARIQLTTSMSAADLAAQGVCTEPHDARLLAIIGAAAVPMAMKPILHTARGEAEVRSLLIEALPQIKDTFAHYRLVKVKRALTHRWVDESCLFDHARW